MHTFMIHTFMMHALMLHCQRRPRLSGRQMQAGVGRNDIRKEYRQQQQNINTQLVQMQFGHARTLA